MPKPTWVSVESVVAVPVVVCDDDEAELVEAGWGIVPFCVDDEGEDCVTVVRDDDDKDSSGPSPKGIEFERRGAGTGRPVTLSYCCWGWGCCWSCCCWCCWYCKVLLANPFVFVADTVFVEAGVAAINAAVGVVDVIALFVSYCKGWLW